MKYFNVKIEKNADGTHSVEVRGVSRAYWQTPCYENESEDYKALLDTMAGQGTSRPGPFSYVDSEYVTAFLILDSATVGSIRDLVDAEIKWTRALCVLNNSIPHEGSLTEMLSPRYGRIPSGDMIFVYGDEVYVKSREEVIKANIRQFKRPILEATRRLSSWVLENEDGLSAAEWTEPIDNPLTVWQFKTLYSVKSYNPFVTKAEFAEQFFFAEDAFGAERAPASMVVPGAVPESELRKTAGLSTTGPLANYECEGQMSFEDMGWTVPGGDGTLPEPQSAAEAEPEEAEEEEIPLDM